MDKIGKVLNLQKYVFLHLTQHLIKTIGWHNIKIVMVLFLRTMCQHGSDTKLIPMHSLME
jgi:hypothetical protein